MRKPTKGHWAARSPLFSHQFQAADARDVIAYFGGGLPAATFMDTSGGTTGKVAPPLTESA
jgi:hypothetical protein